MRCRACNEIMSDRENSRKYLTAEKIKNPEEQFIGLCDRCINYTDLNYTEDSSASDSRINEEMYSVEESFEDYFEER